MTFVSNPASNIPLARYAWLSVAAAIFTLLLKLGAWYLTGSVSMLSDALESLANLAAAFFAVASLTVAARPADEDHAYGHSNAEYFASAVEGTLILAAAAGIGWAAVERLFHPQALEGVSLGISISAVASLVNLAVARVLMRVARSRKSPALEADGKHLMTDVWTSAVTLLAVGAVVLTGWQWLDPVFGLLLAGHIVATGVRLVHQSALGLMDTALPENDLSAVKAILAKLDAEGLQYHALRTRCAGARAFMSVHLLVPGSWSVTQAHNRAEALELELREAVAQLNVITHIEPIGDPVSMKDARLDREPPR
jgi:cation diffusion facilitator family transporter